MLYHVIRRPSNKSESNYTSESVLKLMPRYHYSRIAPSSASASSESFFSRQHLNGQSTKPTMTATTTSNNNNNNNNNNSNPYSYETFKSTFIPLVTNSRTMTPNKREFIQIPVTREDGTLITNNPMRSVPITFISETTSLPSTSSNNSRTSSAKPHYTSLLRPSSKYFHHHSNNNNNDEESPTNIPRLPSVSRRLSFTVPIMTTTQANTTADDDTITKQNRASSPIRQIPIRLSQSSNVASIPTNSSRISSAILRPSPLSNSSNNQLQRQKTDLIDTSSSDFTSTLPNPSPVRRAEVMAREAIQGIVRFQQQQQQRNDSIPDYNNNNITNNFNNISIRSPALSRRVIINLKNNQSISLDSNLSSGNSSSTTTKPPIVPSSSRITQRNNHYHIPVLHEIQMSSHSTPIEVETTFTLSQSPSSSNNNNNTFFKNEFRMEIPVQIITNNDQENRIQQNDRKEDEIVDYDQQIPIITECLPSTNNNNSNQTLKSILKRSSSRETVSRKNVSFMNA